MMHGQEKSDRPVVPVKLPNKAGEPAAEGVEGRGLAKRNPPQSATLRTQGRARVVAGLERIRQAYAVSTQSKSPVR
jgi:hypothetical protein